MILSHETVDVAGDDPDANPDDNPNLNLALASDPSLVVVVVVK